MEVKRSKRFVIPDIAKYEAELKPNIIQSLYEEIRAFRRINWAWPKLIRVSYEEAYFLQREIPYEGPLNFDVIPMTLFNIPLLVCEQPVPRFE